MNETERARKVGSCITNETERTLKEGWNTLVRFSLEETCGEGERQLKVKITLRNGNEIVERTHAPTMEAFMEDIALVTHQAFGTGGKYTKKYGDFLELDACFIRHSEIDVIEEVVEKSETKGM